MAVIIGNSSNGGWSSVTPKPDSNWAGQYPAAWIYHQGTDYTAGFNPGIGAAAGDGTRFMFFSLAGNDLNKGTKLSPILTPIDSSPGWKGWRDSSPDWMLLRKGDTFTGTGAFLPFSTGDVSDPNSYVPIVTSYDPAGSDLPPISNPQTNPPNRPVYQRTTGLGDVDMFTGQNGRANTVCVMGIDWYNYLADPTNAAFVGGSGVSCFRLLSTTTSILVEDCSWRYFSGGLLMIGNQPPAAKVYIRRNAGHKCYSFAFGGGPGGLYEENLADMNGWSLATCTFTSGTTTATDSGGHTFETNCRIKFYAGSGASLPSNVSQDDLYFVTSSSAGNFTISATPGGTAITFSSAGSGTLYFRCPGLDGIYRNIDGRTHNMYLSGVHFEAPPQSFPSNALIAAYDLRGNIDSNSCFDTQARCGGTYFNQLYLNQAMTHNEGAPTGATYDITTSYCCADGCFEAFYPMNAAYAFYSMGERGINFHHNIAANEFITTGGGTVFSYVLGHSGGLMSNNIRYKCGVTWTNAGLFNGAILALHQSAGGGTPDGRMLNFQGDYPANSGGGTCVTNITNTTSDGVAGSYSVFFTPDGGSTYPGLRGTVIVGGGGTVTGVSITGFGVLTYSTSATTFTELKSSEPGLPTTWSFDFTPYVVEMQDQTNPGVTPGTGAQVYLILMSGSVQQWNLVDETNVVPPYSDRTYTDVAVGGGVKIVAGGIDYSTGQILKPVTLISGPAGKTIADVPSNFRLTVGAYPAFTSAFDGGSVLTNVSGSMAGSGGSIMWDITTNGAGVTTYSNFRIPTTEVNYNPRGKDYQVNDVCSIPNLAGATGVQITIDRVGSNTDDGTSIQSSDGVNFSKRDGTVVANPNYPYPDRARIASGSWGVGYYESIGAPGGQSLTVDGFVRAVIEYQRKGTWRNDLTAASACSFIRAGFGMSDPGDTTGGSNVLLMGQACL